MSRTPVAIGVTAFISIVFGSVAFILDSTILSPGSATMVLIGFIGLGLGGLAGLLLVRAPWSRWLLGSTVGVVLLLASSGNATLFWLSLGLGAVAIVGLAGPWLTLWVRREPVADALGKVPVALIASGALAPILLGLGAADGVTWMHWMTVALTAGSAWAYGRGVPLGIWGFRVAVPIVGLTTALATPGPGRYLIGAGAIATGAAAWSRAASRVTAVITLPLPAPSRRRNPDDTSH